MGRYISKSDIEDLFGVENVAVYSNLENEDDGADDDRIDRAIAQAEAKVEARLRGGRYAMPLVGNSSDALLIIKDICARYAGVWLFQSRGVRPDEADANAMAVHEEAANQMLNDLHSGVLKLDAVMVRTGPTAPIVVGVHG
jgi:phage gp36-like protein